MEKEIVIFENGIGYDISDTALIKDYRKEKYIPDVDKLLDWRYFLMTSNTTNKAEKLTIKKEIIATDYLLNLKQNK